MIFGDQATVKALNKVTITAPATAATLTIANGKTLTQSNSLTFVGTDGSSVNFGAGGTVLYSSGSTGTNNTLSKFNSSGQLVDSRVTDNGTTLTLSPNLTYSAGTMVLGGTADGIFNLRNSTNDTVAEIQTGGVYGVISVGSASTSDACYLNGNGNAGVALGEITFYLSSGVAYANFGGESSAPGVVQVNDADANHNIILTGEDGSANFLGNGVTIYESVDESIDVKALSIGGGSVGYFSITSGEGSATLKFNADFGDLKIGSGGAGVDGVLTLINDSDVEAIKLDSSIGVGTFHGGIVIGTITRTALLHIKAGTSSSNTSPLKFEESAVTLPTAEKGAFDFNSGVLYFTPASSRKTIAFLDSAITGFTGTLSISNGGSGQTSANAALNAFLPSQTGNSGKYLTTDGSNTSWVTISGLGVGTVTSVAVTGSEFTITGSPITTSGTINLSITNSAITLAKLANIADATILGNDTGGSAAPVALSASAIKTLLSLNSVENTALSTWAGTANIVTVGTITTGVWSGTVIVDGKIASALTGKSYNGLTLTSTTGTLTISNSKTLTISNSITFTATDGSTLAIGAGGTLGSNAYTSTAFAPLESPTFTGTVTIPTSFVISSTTVTTTGTQLNYLNAATGTTGTTSTNIVFSTSPTLVTPVLGVATVTSINKVTITQPTTSATLTLVTGSSLITVGAFSLTLTTTATTDVTFPTTGTLATLAGSESLTNKKLGSLTTNGFVKTSGSDGTLSVLTALTNSDLPNYSSVSWTSYSDTITWTGTISPSGATTHEYRYERIGKMVMGFIRLEYATGGGANTAVELATSSFPVMSKPSNASSGENMISCSGFVDDSNTGNVPACRAFMIESSGTSGFTVKIVVGSTNAKVASCSFSYLTA